jgi:hypothetical protein
VAAASRADGEALIRQLLPELSDVLSDHL